MTDIVLRLKDHYAAKDTDAWMDCIEAANEIEKLRAALRQAAKHICALRDDTSIEPVDADNKNEWPEYIRDALEKK